MFKKAGVKKKDLQNPQTGMDLYDLYLGNAFGERCCFSRGGLSCVVSGIRILRLKPLAPFTYEFPCSGEPPIPFLCFITLLLLVVFNSKSIFIS